MAAKASPSRYVVFLRAINVGGRVVKMERLRELFGEIKGVKGDTVETFIQSGNVIFDSATKDAAALEQKIERHLSAALGYEVTTFLRSVDEVADIAASDPFGRVPDGAVLYVAFLQRAPSKGEAERFLALTTESDRFLVKGREAYWLRVSRERDFASSFLEKTLGQPATVRNVTTVSKIAAKYRP
jgi:uncharacterized protein (DUF1697 family)